MKINFIALSTALTVITIVAVIIFGTKSYNSPDANTGLTETDENTLAAREILALRHKYAPEIRQATVECLQNANNNRDVEYNDSNEVVESCTEYALELYGATSPFMSGYLVKAATRKINGEK